MCKCKCHHDWRCTQQMTPFPFLFMLGRSWMHFITLHHCNTWNSWQVLELVRILFSFRVNLASVYLRKPSGSCQIGFAYLFILFQTSIRQLWYKNVVNTVHRVIHKYKEWKYLPCDFRCYFRRCRSLPIC